MFSYMRQSLPIHLPVIDHSLWPYLPNIRYSLRLYLPIIHHSLWLYFPNIRYSLRLYWSIIHHAYMCLISIIAYAYIWLSSLLPFTYICPSSVTAYTYICLPQKAALADWKKVIRFGWWWWSLPVWCGQEQLKSLISLKLYSKITRMIQNNLLSSQTKFNQNQIKIQS